MLEIIKILKNDLSYISASKSLPVSNSACEVMSEEMFHRCSNCKSLEHQLKVMSDEVSSTKLIIETLKEKIKFLKQKNLLLTLTII